MSLVSTGSLCVQKLEYTIQAVLGIEKGARRQAKGRRRGGGEEVVEEQRDGRTERMEMGRNEALDM